MAKRALSTTETGKGSKFRRNRNASRRSVSKLNPEYNRPFVLAWHPERWDVLDNNELLPILKRFTNTPGLHGLLDGMDIEALESSITNKLGWVFILEDDTREYVVEHDTSFGIPAYLPSWEIPKMNSDVTSPDWEAYSRFIDSCIEDGTIQMPSVDWVLEKIDNWTILRENMLSKLNGIENTTTRRLAEKIAVLEDYLSPQEEEEKPKPSRTRKSND